MPKAKTSGRPSVYPWDKWFASTEPVILRRGKRRQFTCKPVSLVNSIYARASERGLRVKVRVAGNVIVLTNLGTKETGNGKN